MLLATSNDVSLIVTLAGVLFASITAPLILVYINERARRASRREDAEYREGVDKKLKVIHKLVNGNLTATMQRELRATEREVALMKRVRALAPEGNPDADAEITRVEARVLDLANEIAARLDRDRENKRIEGNTDE